MSSVPRTIIKKNDFQMYPFLTRLLELHDCPSKITYEGTLPTITFDEYGRATPRILTIVGSRKNSTYGKLVVEKLIKELSPYNVIIISGLALGIDGLSHKNALVNNLKTIAIPGSGLAQHVLYPSTHRQLAKEILDNNGALISEYDDTTNAAPWTFPKRNRIMAALADALLVVEAEEQSGTLITARLALELGKDIGVVPGEIFSPTSVGTNMLIHEGAYPITSTKDLLELLHIVPQTQEITLQLEMLTSEEKIILELLRQPLLKDELFTLTKLTFVEFITAFSSLEIKGYLQETFGEVRRLV